MQRIHDPTGKPVGFFRVMRDGLGLALGLDAKEVGAVSEEQCPVGHGRGSLEVSVELIGGDRLNFLRAASTVVLPSRFTK